MRSRYILFYLLLVIILFVACSKKTKTGNQGLDSSSAELTLPQIPKLSGPYKPTNRDIQIALKNAGFYEDNIDGDIGPATKRAIREFQAGNELIVDGKVGPKTWALLKKYLITPKQTNVSLGQDPE